MDYLNCAGILLVLVLTLVLGTNLKRALSEIRRALSEIKGDTGDILDRFQMRLPHHHCPDPPRAEEYSIWACRQGQWRLERQCTDPGLEAGPPPGRKGLYEGEVVRTRGIRKQQG